MKVSIDIKGLEKSIKDVARYKDARVDGIKQTVKETAENIEQTAKQKVPVREGDTRDSILAIVFNKGLSATIAPRKPKGWKAHWIELGTAPRYTKKGRFTGSMPATPFMTPAAEIHRPEYVKDLENEMRKV